MPRRVVRVPATRDGDTLRDGHRRDPARARRRRRSSRAEVERGRAAGGRQPAAARPRPHRHPVRDDRPGGVDGPRPGAAHRARRRRLPSCTTRSPTSRRSSRRATRSTRRRTGAARRCTAPTRKIPLHPTVLSEGAASLLPDADRPGAAVDDQGRRRRRGHRRATSSGRWCAAAPSSTTTACSRASTPGTADESFALLARGRASCASSGRPSAAGCRCRCPSRRSTSTATRWPLAFRAHAAGRGVERADLAAHRDGRRVADGLRAGRACCARCRRRTRATCSGCTAPPRRCGIEWPAELLYPDFIRSLDPDEPEPRRDGRGLHPAAARRRATSRFDGETPEQPRARRAGLGVRPRHRAAAPARRPVRRRGLRRAVRRDRGARVGAGAARRRCPRRCRPSGQRAHRYERAVLDLVEAAVLAPARRRDVRRGRRRASDDDGPAAAATSSCRSPRSRRRVRSARACRSAPTSRRGWSRRTRRPGTVRFELLSGAPDRAASTGPRMSRPGGRGEATRRGRSGLHRARWWVTPTRGDPRDSATENRPPPRLGGAVRVKRWCKRPPALRVTGAAR